MERRILWRANLKQHRGSVCSIFILLLLISVSLASVLTVWNNSSRYVREEMERLGYGTITAWISGASDIESLLSEISALEDVQSVNTQQLIYSEYEIGEHKSDSEGQLLIYNPEKMPYHIFSGDLSGYQSESAEIMPGEIYVSPSMISMFGLSVGDEICFPIARGGMDKTFVVKGYFEDPFMGSAMIGMKSFLICEQDYEEIADIVENARVDGLARLGDRIHIFQAEESELNIVQLNGLLNQSTSLSNNMEFAHSDTAIAGFMLTLQNVFTGFLLAFTVILVGVSLIVLGHSIGSIIEQDYVNMGILKAMGFTGRKLRELQLLQYLTGILPGIMIGIFFSIPVANLICRMTVTTTGVLVPSNLPAGLCFLAFFVLLFFLTSFIWFKTGSMMHISPMDAIRSGAGQLTVSKEGRRGTLRQRGIGFWLALRQVSTGKRRYFGVGLVALLLVFFLSMIGRVNDWLGPEGEGLMDAFNAADLHIAAQPVNEADNEKVEQLIRSYTEITDQYRLAMPNVSINGVDYTANVITQPQRFHILKGETCEKSNEVVLTEFVASDLNVSIGDTVTLTGNLGSSEFIVSGIYQCANDMGANLGMNREGYHQLAKEEENIWCTHYFLADASLQSDIMQALEENFGGNVYLHENSWPGLYGILSAMRLLMVFLYSIVLIFILVVTFLTAGRLMKAEQKDLGIYKTIGFTDRQLRFSFALRFGIVSVLGNIVGILLSVLFTDSLVGMLMRMEGISNFSSQPDIGTVLLPAIVVILAFVLFAYLVGRRIKKLPLSVLTRE